MFSLHLRKKKREGVREEERKEGKRMGKYVR